ncbi:MAG: hypothetical protein KKH94_07550 [Candidatus Omnitrophica bacterium]|nr:hypothetical protein [Candidatus Omnitrophota bacterium]
MNYFNGNLQSLDVRFGALVQRLESVSTNNPSFSILKAKDDSCTAKVFSDGGKEQFLHSVYNPCKEAETMSREVYREDIDLFVIVGFGLGYHVLQLYKQLIPTQKILIVEPCPPLFKEALTRIDYHAPLGDDRVFIIVEENRFRMEQMIKTVINNFVPYDRKTFTIDFIPFYKRWDRYNTFFHDMRGFIDKALSQIQTAREQLVYAIDDLRTGGLGKTFLGSYKDCLSYFRTEVQEGRPFDDKKIGLLAAYYLFSHYSYAETFEEGNVDGT